MKFGDGSTVPAGTVLNLLGDDASGKTVVQAAFSGAQIAAANYTLAATDLGAVKEFNSVTAQTWTIPLATVASFPVYAVLTGIQTGAGAVTIVAASGVTITTALTSLISKGASNVFQLMYLGGNKWLAFGGLGG
jgi:hypothetical protein